MTARSQSGRRCGAGTAERSRTRRSWFLGWCRGRGRRAPMTAAFDAGVANPVMVGAGSPSTTCGAGSDEAVDGGPAPTMTARESRATIAAQSTTRTTSSLSDSGFSINNDGCSAAPARSSDRRRRPDHVLTGFISARRWRHGRPISRISTENRLFASLGRAQDKDPLHVPRHGHKTPFAAHLIQPTQ